MNHTATSSAPETLRATMVDRIRAAGHARTSPVEQALRTVPRHEFVPSARLEDAYADIAVITKRSAEGAALSCASVPTIVAMMLDQLDVRPGDRILEIGAGTGYNAALLAQLTGPDGSVTTVDIDPEVTAAARQALNTTGHRAVRVITRDGALGDPDHSPYDRIIVTVGAWDIPTAWREQLVPGGRLVLPLRWRGQTRSIAFVRDGDVLHSESLALCGFVPMIGQDRERSGHLDSDGHVTLYWDADQPVDSTLVAGILQQDPTTAWSGITIAGNVPFDGIWLNLTATEPSTCRITADPTAVETGLCTPAIPARSPALIADSSLAYLTLRRLDHTASAMLCELGAIGHGPLGQHLAHRLCEHIRTWHPDRPVQPTVTAYPSGMDTTVLREGLAVPKSESTLIITPSAQS